MPEGPDAQHFVLAASVKAHNESVTALCLIGTGLIATAGDDLVKVWACDEATLGEMGELKCERSLRHEFKPWALASHEAQLASAGFEQSNVMIWDLETQMCRQLGGHRSGVRALSWLDVNTLACSTGDSLIDIWDLRKGEKCQRLASGVAYALERVDEMTLVSTSSCDIKIWDLRSQACHTLQGHEYPIYSLASDACSLFSADSESIRLWDIRSREARQTVRQEGVLALDYTVTLASAGRELKVWDIQLQAAQALPHEGSIYALAWKDADTLCAAGQDPTLMLWTLPQRHARKRTAQRPYEF